MSSVEAWVCYWDEEAAKEQCRRIEEFCGVEAHYLCLYDHESRVINKALSLCKSDYFWYVVPDVDLLYPDTAELMIAYLDDNPHVGLIRPNREGEARNSYGNYPYNKYLDDGTAWMYRMSIGVEWDEEFVFTGWADLDFGESITATGNAVVVDPRISVYKHPTKYGEWSNFRRAYNARNRLLLEAKWYWDNGIYRWRGIDHYNLNCESQRRIPTEFELAWYSEEKLKALAQSVNYEHPPIMMRKTGGSDPGNINWELPSWGKNS